MNDSVRISPPYTPEDCKAAKDQQANLVRVKRVLENERKKLALKATEGGEEKAPTGAKPDVKPAGNARGSMIATPYPRKGG